MMLLVVKRLRCFKLGYDTVVKRSCCFQVFHVASSFGNVLVCNQVITLLQNQEMTLKLLVILLLLLLFYSRWSTGWPSNLQRCFVRSVELCKFLPNGFYVLFVGSREQELRSSYLVESTLYVFFKVSCCDFLHSLPVLAIFFPHWKTNKQFLLLQLEGKF